MLTGAVWCVVRGAQLPDDADHELVQHGVSELPELPAVRVVHGLLAVRAVRRAGAAPPGVHGGVPGRPLDIRRSLHGRVRDVSRRGGVRLARRAQHGLAQQLVVAGNAGRVHQLTRGSVSTE